MRPMRVTARKMLSGRHCACLVLLVAGVTCASAFTAPSAGGILSRRVPNLKTSRLALRPSVLQVQAQQTTSFPDLSTLGKVTQQLGKVPGTGR